MHALKAPSGEYKSILLLRITCVCWLLSKLISWRLWTTFRILPTAPVFEGLNAMPSTVHSILFGAAILLMVIACFKGTKPIIIALLITELLSCLLDQNRWQPWEYQYIFIFFAFAINRDKPKSIAVIVVLTLASTYFFGGINKLNPIFLHTVWGNTLLRFFFENHPRIWHLHWLYYGGYLIGILEIIAGLGLLYGKTQTKSAVFLIAMHVGILVLFSPAALNINQVILPWNIALLLYLYVIFLRDKIKLPLYESVVFKWNKLFILFWVILPALSFVGFWDKALSSNLYSGRLPQMIVYINNVDACKELQPFYFKKERPRGAKLNMLNWAFIETNTPGYMDIRVYNIIKKKLIAKYRGAGFKFVYLNN